MHPHIFAFEKSKRNGRKSVNEDKRGGWLSEICVALSNGDILKRDEITWGFTLEEVKPYLAFKIRDITFREAVLSFLGVKTQTDIEDEYCTSCKQARGIKSDEHDEKCETCSKEIVKEEKKENKTIGRQQNYN